MWYWIVAAFVFVIAMTVAAVIIFREEWEDSLLSWFVGAVLSAIYSVAWIVVVPITVLAGICCGLGWKIYNKWFKKKKVEDNAQVRSSGHIGYRNYTGSGGY